jgi:type I restriction enzyme R subunit
MSCKAAHPGAFYRSLMKAVNSSTGEDALDEETHQRVLDLTKDLVGEFQEVTQIVGFFDKRDEVARIKRQIKRSIQDQPFGDRDLVDAVTERFMDMGKRHFR